MNKKNAILTLLSVVLIFFLFAPIVVRSLQSFATHSVSVQLAKSKGSPTKADSQMPIEDREKEEKTIDDVHDQFTIFYIEHSCILSSSTSLKVDSRLAAFGFFSNTPLYLAKRSLLI